MVSVLSPRKLFHLALRLYFGCSLMLCLWHGSKLGIDKKRSEDTLSTNMTVSLRQIYGDIEYGNSPEDDVGYLSDETFFKSITLESEAYNGADNKIGEGFENYPEKMSYDYNENLGHDAKLKEKIYQEKNVTDSENGSFVETKNETAAQKWSRLVKEQNGLYTHPVVRRVRDADVFYITAVSTDVSDGTEEANGDTEREVTVNGWQGKKKRTGRLFCCIKGNNSLYSSEVFKRNIWDVPDIKVVTATQFHCNISTSSTPKKQFYIGLSEKPSCKKVEYIKIEPEMTPPSVTNTTFAVCAKIVYGNFPALRLVEWLEFNKALGVDSISLFTYNVTKDLMTVLKHYQEEGFLTMKEFDYPLKFRYPRSLGQKYMMAYMDEQVTVFDCVQRFRKYTYIAIIDVDEFIMPKFGQLNLKSMMGNLLRKNPTAAGFTFMTSLFVTDWNKTHPHADFTIGQYTLKTKAIWDRRKSVIVSDRVLPSSIWTHGFSGVGKYIRVYLYLKQAVIYHYRKCRENWLATDTCYKNRHQYRDVSMKVVLTKIRDILLEKRKLFLL